MMPRILQHRQVECSAELRAVGTRYGRGKFRGGFVQSPYCAKEGLYKSKVCAR